MMKIIGKVISGGQTGADTAGLRAAQRCGIPTGGTAPKGYMTELGPRSSFLKRFDLIEHQSERYPPRTIKNIENSDLTLILSSPHNLDGGSLLTLKMCLKLGKYAIVASIEWDDIETKEVEKLIRRRYVRKPLIINIAGDREGKSPGIEDRASDFLTSLFRRLR